MIILNSEKAFESDKSAVTVINRLGEIKDLSLDKKSSLAIDLIKLIAANLIRSSIDKPS